MSEPKLGWSKLSCNCSAVHKQLSSSKEREAELQKVLADRMLNTVSLEQHRKAVGLLEAAEAGLLKANSLFDEKEGQTNYCPQCEELQAKVTRLRENLTALVDRYTSLVNSGDAGSWNPEEETEIINARAALSDTADNDKWLAQVKVKMLESLLKRSVEVDTPDGIELHVPCNVIHADIVILRNQAKKG